jgi:MFS transporter, FSR family, fosmidomycin resistance protein
MGIDLLFYSVSANIDKLLKITDRDNRRWLSIAVLSLAHGLADAAAGLLVVRLATVPINAGLTILMYQVLAFAMQPIVGLIIDRYRIARSGVILALLATGIGILCRSSSPTLAILLAGLGAAIFHVSAGAIVAVESCQSIVSLGWFAAPGVVGLAIGGYAALNYPNDGYMILLLGAMALSIDRILPPSADLAGGEKIERESAILLAGKESIGLLLVVAIAVRSLVWNLVDVIHRSDSEMLIYLAVAAGMGKIVGGMFAARFGWRRWGTIALFTAAACLNFGIDRVELLLLGVALLQSVTPIALAATISLCPGLPATGTGLALGLGIAMGGILLLLLPPVSWTMGYLGAIALLASILLRWSIDPDT